MENKDKNEKTLLIDFIDSNEVSLVTPINNMTNCHSLNRLQLDMNVNEEQ